jgi:adenosylhomocysteinase
MTEGARRVDWVGRRMALLQRLHGQLLAERPFAGRTIGICLHIEPKTAVMCGVLSAGGARLAITGSPGTTQDDVADALRADGHLVCGCRADTPAEHAANIAQVIAARPDILLDNGASLVEALLRAGGNVIGGTEETTTGANLLREQMAGQVSFPVIVINDSPLKLIMENEHGVGPTVVASFLKVTNLQVPAKRFAVFGYGSVGRGIAKSLQAQHGLVTVVEPDPIRALEAVLQGFVVASTEAALRNNDVLITATGRPGAIAAEHLPLLRDGAILVNTGHYSWEIDLAALRATAVSYETIDAGIEVFAMPDGRRLNLLARGEMLNLAGGGGNPVETMDLGLALQILSLRRIALQAATLPAGPQPVPADINREVAQGMVELLCRA